MRWIYCYFILLLLLTLRTADSHVSSDQKRIDQWFLPACHGMIVEQKNIKTTQLCDDAMGFLQQLSTNADTSTAIFMSLGGGCTFSDTLLECLDRRILAAQSKIIYAIEQAMCQHPNAWLRLGDGWSVRTQRGQEVYRSREMIYNCQTQQFARAYDNDFLPEVMLQVEDEYHHYPYIDEVVGHIENNYEVKALKLIENYSSNGDDDRDKQMLYALAADEKHLPYLQALLKQRSIAVNYDTDYYRQPLSLLIEEGQEKAALELLQSGADPMIPNVYGQSLLTLAAHKGMLTLIEKLMEKGLDVDGIKGSENFNFAQPLSYAATTGQAKTVDFLLGQGAQLKPEKSENHPQWNSHELLENAVFGGSFKVVQTLLDAGLEIQTSKRLLKNLVRTNQLPIWQLLEKKGLTLPDKKTHKAIYSSLSRLIDRADSETLKNGHYFFQRLLLIGLDVSQPFTVNKSLAYQSVYDNLSSSVDLAKTQESQLIKRRRTTFALDALKALVAAEIDINETDENKNTLLHHAARLGQHQVVKALLKNNSDVNRLNKEHKTALQQAKRQAKSLTEYYPDDEVIRNNYQKTIDLLNQANH